MSWGVQPQAMIGHSVGEFVAACLAGVFTLKEALGLIAARARLVQEQPAGSMLAIRLPQPEVERWVNVTGYGMQDAGCSGNLSLAAVNSPSVCVVSGPTEEIKQLQAKLKEQGIASQRLQTSHAFHSAMMDPVMGPLTELAR